MARRGVARVAVLVRPVPGAGQSAAGERGPRSFARDRRLLAQLGAGQPACQRVDGHRFAGCLLRPAEAHHAADRLEMPHDGLGCDAGQLALGQQRVGNDQVREVVRVRQVGEIGLMHGHAMAVVAGRRQDPPGLVHFRFVGFDRVDPQVAAPRELVGQLSLLVADHQAEASL